MNRLFSAFFFSLLLLTPLFNNPVAAQTVETLVPGPSTFDDGLAIDKEGNIYASRYFGTTVTKITLEGNTSTFASGLTNPNGITFDKEGNLYIPNAQGNRIDKVDPEGERTTLVNSIANPTGLLFLEDGNLLIAQYQPSTISVRDTSGQVTTFLTGNGLNGPVGLQKDEEGNLYIGNFNDGKVFKRTPDGNISEIGDIPGWLGFITYSNGYIYATGYQQHRIYRINTDGTEQKIYAGTGVAGGNDGSIEEATFNGPNGIVASATGDTLFISDFETRSLRMIIGVNTVSTPSEYENEQPEEARLDQNYPNPFNPSTVIRFQLAKPSKVSLTVFDTMGREVEQLASSTFGSGNHTINFNAYDLSSGIYYYSLVTEAYTLTKKMTLIK